MRNLSFEHAAELIGKLKNHGFSAYIVGGAVRDHLLGKDIDDIDIATSAKPEEVAAVFPKTIPVGIEHGTIVVRYHDRSYEVTTFRSESEYEDHRRPASVTFVASLEEDLQRRDFTINAMAMTETGEIADPFSGKDDLRNRLIRSVGQAEERFEEDPLRMMRAARFASQLCFGIDPETEAALKKMAADLRHISVERITIEFEKLLLGPCMEKALGLLVGSQLSEYLPGLSGMGEALMDYAKVEQALLTSIEERWAFFTLYLQMREPVEWLKNWKLSNEKIKQIIRIGRFVETVSNHEWAPFDVYEAGLKTAISVEKIRSLLYKQQPESEEIEHIYNRLPLKNRKELAVNGNDLLEWFVQRPGPWVSEWLKAAEKAVVEGSIVNRKGEVRKWLLNQTC